MSYATSIKSMIFLSFFLFQVNDFLDGIFCHRPLYSDQKGMLSFILVSPNNVFWVRIEGPIWYSSIASIIMYLLFFRAIQTLYFHQPTYRNLGYPWFHLGFTHHFTYWYTTYHHLTHHLPLVSPWFHHGFTHHHFARRGPWSPWFLPCAITTTPSPCAVWPSRYKRC